jgi:hypothetical protein
MLNSEVKKLLNQTGQLITDKMIDTAIANGSLASGQLIRSIGFKETSKNETTGITVSTVDYAKWVDEGRRPGKMPPVQDILQWVKVKPVRARRLTQESLAWAIAKTIAKRGVRPRPFIQNSINSVMRNFRDDLILAGREDIIQYLDTQLELTTEFKVK